MHVRTGVNGDAFALEDAAHLLRHVVVLAPDETRPLLDDRHFSAKSPIHLRELEADVAPADDDQMLRYLIERQDGGVRQERHVADARHLGHQRAASDVDEDARRRQLLLIDANDIPGFESSMSFEDRAAVHVPQPLLDAGA